MSYPEWTKSQLMLLLLWNKLQMGGHGKLKAAAILPYALCRFTLCPYNLIAHTEYKPYHVGGVILAIVLAAWKFALPVVAAIVAFVVAGVTSINGETVSSVISTVLGAVSAFFAYASMRAAQKRLGEMLEERERSSEGLEASEGPERVPWWRRVFGG